MNITRVRGDNYDNLIQVVDGTGTAISLTSETFILTVNSEECPTDNTNEIFSVAGVVTDAANGRVSFADDGTTDIGTYHYDIQMIDTSGRRRTIAKDYYIVTQDITK